jgi:hypothetical protein
MDAYPSSGTLQAFTSPKLRDQTDRVGNDPGIPQMGPPIHPNCQAYSDQATTLDIRIRAAAASRGFGI